MFFTYYRKLNHNVEGAHQCKYSMSTKPQFRGFLTHVHPFAICLVLTCLLLFFNVFFSGLWVVALLEQHVYISSVTLLLFTLVNLTFKTATMKPGIFIYDFIH